MDTAAQIEEMLKRKDDLDRRPDGRGDQVRLTWLMMAVELLLVCELQRHEY
jgi:hypothetical protein